MLELFGSLLGRVESVGDGGREASANEADVEELCAVLLAAWERLASAPLSASSSGIVRSATVSASGGEHVALALDEYRALLTALKLVPLVCPRAATCLLDSTLCLSLKISIW